MHYMQKNNINHFWRWFAENQVQMEDLLQKSKNTEMFISEIDFQVKKLDSRLNWEIGPGINTPYAFSFSPSNAKELLYHTNKAVNNAPKLQGWQFFPAKPPKPGWNLLFEISNKRKQCITINASDWYYYIISYAKGKFYDVFFIANQIPFMDSAAKRIAARIVAEGVLGEKVLMLYLDRIELRKTIPANIKQNLSHIKYLSKHFNNFLLCKDDLSEI